MKKPPANSPSLWQAGAKTPWVVIDPRSTYGFWMYFSPSLLLLVPYVSPVQGGHCSLDSGLYGCVKQLSVPRVAHLGRPGEALGSWCFTTSVWTTLCNEMIVHLLTYFPGHSRNTCCFRRTAMRTSSAHTCRSNLQYCDTTDWCRSIAGLLAWYWCGRNGHHTLMVISTGPLKQGVGWGIQKPGPLASLNRTKATSEAQTGPNHCVGSLILKAGRKHWGRWQKGRRKKSPVTRIAMKLGRMGGGYRRTQKTSLNTGRNCSGWSMQLWLSAEENT